jgi:hypothetical protein
MKTTQNTLTADLQMGRIQKVSSIVRTLFLAALIIEVVGMAGRLVALLFMCSRPSTFESRADFNNGAEFLVLPFAFMVTLHFFHFFSRLKNSLLFEVETTRHLESAGKWWIALGIVQAILQFSGGCIYTPSNIVVTGSNQIFGGLVVFFIAWVFRVGMKLKEEQELTAMVYQLASKVACKNPSAT